MEGDTTGLGAGSICKKHRASLNSSSLGERGIFPTDGQASVCTGLVEGFGNVTTISGGVLLESDAEGFDIPEREATTPIETPAGIAGLGSLSAIDVSGNDFMVLLHSGARANNAGGRPQKFRCLLVRGSATTLAPFAANLSVVSRNECPGRLARDGLGPDKMTSSAENATPFQDGVVWSPIVGYSNLQTIPVSFGFAPHVADDLYRWFRFKIPSPSELSLVFFGEQRGDPHLDIWRATDSLSAIGLDHQSTPTQARVILLRGGYVQPAALDGNEQLSGGRRWFMPGQRSVRTHDTGREVLVVRPDGVLYSVGITAGEISLEMAGNIGVESGFPIKGAVRHGDRMISTHVVITPEQPLRESAAIAPVPIALPESQGFLVSGFLPTLFICPPASVPNLDSLELTIDGMPPRYFFEDPERTDGCAVAVAAPEAKRAIVRATLPNVGRVTAFPANSQKLFFFGNQYKGIPLRNKGFISAAQHSTAAGTIDRPPRNGSPGVTHNPDGILRDVGGYGYWTTRNGSLDTLRLIESDHSDWQPLPFALGTVANILTRSSLSSLGTLYVCANLVSGYGCLAVHVDGSYEEIPQAEILNLAAELDDGTRCFSTPGLAWCGQPDDPSSAASLSINVTVSDVIPFSDGFYFRSNGPYRYFDAATNTIQNLNVEVDVLFRVSDENVVGVSGTNVVNMVGNVATEVLDAGAIAIEYGITLNDQNLTPGKDYVLVGQMPIPYDL